MTPRTTSSTVALTGIVTVSYVDNVVCYNVSNLRFAAHKCIFSSVFTFYSKFY